MNSKKSPPARVMPFNRQAESARQFKPVVAQVKTVPSDKSFKRPEAPPVYKPQASPVGAQLKKAGPLQVKTPPVAPVAYRPQPIPAVLQRKVSAQLPGTKQPDRKPLPKKIHPASSPVYRPQPSPKVLQTKKVGQPALQNIRSTGANGNAKSATINSIQRAIDPWTVLGVGALLVSAVGLAYNASKYCGSTRESGVSDPPEEKKEAPLTKADLIPRITALKLKAKLYKDIKQEIRAFEDKLDKPSYDYAHASQRLTDLEKKVANRERCNLSSASPYASMGGESKSRRRVKGRKQEEGGSDSESEEEEEDIKPQFNPAKACVLYALIRLKGSAFGENSALKLHNLFWSPGAFTNYRQYSDMATIRALFSDRRAGMTAVGAIVPDTISIGDLPERLGAGRYAVITRSSNARATEEHMLILEGGSWLEFRGHGFVPARIDENAMVRGVWH